MKRRIFNAMAVVSAVLCVVSIMMSVRSASHFDGVEYEFSPPMDATASVWSGMHTLIFDLRSDDRPPNHPGSWRVTSCAGSRAQENCEIELGTADDCPGIHFMGFRASRWRSPNGREFLSFVTIPYMAVSLVGLVLPAPKLRTLRGATSRRRHGKCESCGYDLRATPERCPECGMIPPAKAKAIA